MTKTTSASRAMLKKLILMPLLSALIFFTCVKTIAQEKKVESTMVSETQATGMEKYFENTIFKISDATGNIISEKKFNQLTTEEKKNIPPPPPPVIAPKSKQEKSKQLEDQKNAEGPKYIELIVDNSNTDSVYNVADTETKPTFPGGMNAFYQFVAENFKVSEEASKMKLKGKVYITFMIEKDGTLSEFRILRDMGYGTGEEAVRVLKLSPTWIAATVNNKPVRVQYSLPITIQTD
jgi:hypothetical protein